MKNIKILKNFPTGHDGQNKTGDEDLGGLSYLILIAAIAGGISSIAFFVLVKEPKTESTFEKMPHSETEHVSLTVFFYEIDFGEENDHDL